MEDPKPFVCDRVKRRQGNVHVPELQDLNHSAEMRFNALLKYSFTVKIFTACHIKNTNFLEFYAEQYITKLEDKLYFFFLK